MDLAAHKVHRIVGHENVNGCVLRGTTQETQSIPDSTITQVDFASGASTEVYYDTDGAAGDLANNRIIVPEYANWVYVCGHSQWKPQSNGEGIARVHLFRDDDGFGPSSTNEDLYYHNSMVFPILAAGYISMIATTGLWMPIIAAGEKWSLHVYQSTGAATDLALGLGCWLGVWWKP